MSDLLQVCGHCGHAEALRTIQHVTVEERVVEAHDNHGPVEVHEQTRVEIARCSVCKQLTFTQYVWVDEFFDEPSDAADVTQLFPAMRDAPDLPSRVARRYAEMLQKTHEPGNFAVNAGKVLEAICRDQGIGPKNEKGKRQDLFKRLDLMVEQNGLPEALGEQAHLVRDYRNIGGHDDDLEITAADVPLLRSFVEAVLEFLYWGPNRLARGTAELARRQDALADK